MNVARKIESTRKLYNDRHNKADAFSKGAEVIYLVNKTNDETKEYTVDYLNERLAYFYNHGGPIMEL